MNQGPKELKSSQNQVDVIIPIRESEPYLVATLQSVVGQTLQPKRIVLVYDLENSPSYIAAKEFEQTTEQELIRTIEFVYIKSRGRSAALSRNTGLDFITNSPDRPNFIAFIDADDVWQSSKLKLQIKQYENSHSREQIGIIYCTYNVIDEDGKPHKDFKGTSGQPMLRRGNHGFDNLFNIPQKHAFPIPSTILMPEHAYIVCRFDEELFGCEDLDFAINVARRFDIVSMPNPLLLYRRHSTNMSNDESHIRIHTARVYSKHYNDFEHSVKIRDNHPSRHRLALELIMYSFPASAEFKKFPLQKILSRNMQKLLFGSSRLLYATAHLPELIILIIKSRILGKAKWRTF